MTPGEWGALCGRIIGLCLGIPLGLALDRAICRLARWWRRKRTADAGGREDHAL